MHTYSHLKVNMYVVHDDDTMGLLQWNGSELRSDGYSTSAPSAQFYSNRTDDYKYPTTAFTQQSPDGKQVMLAVYKNGSGHLRFTFIPVGSTHLQLIVRVVIHYIICCII